MHAAIIAGGEGTRMRPVSRQPKAMLPIQGKPLLTHQLEWLKSAGFKNIFLCLGYGAVQIRDHFQDGSSLGLNLDYRIEKEPRGTAGAVKDLEPELGEDLLVVYGDLFIRMDCPKLLDFHAKHAGLATIVARRTDHPEDSDLLEAAADGRVLKVARGLSTDLACAAVWVIRKGLLAYAPKDKPSDFAKHVFPKAVSDGKTLMAYKTDELVADVGTPRRYEAVVKKLSPS
ncbi:MAG: NDP-sugar synthase [Elusimicrobiota bacterium]